MAFNLAWAWLIAGLVLGGAEIVTGTFYLLVLGAACLAGALAAAAEMSLAWQFAACAVLAVAGCFVVHRLRKPDAADESRRLQNIDEGQRVVIDAVAADGTADVLYRGSCWKAVPEAGAALEAGPAAIVRLDGARLVVKQQSIHCQ